MTKEIRSSKSEGDWPQRRHSTLCKRRTRRGTHRKEEDKGLWTGFTGFTGWGWNPDDPVILSKNWTGWTGSGEKVGKGLSGVWNRLDGGRDDRIDRMVGGAGLLDASIISDVPFSSSDSWQGIMPAYGGWCRWHYMATVH